MPSFKNLLIGGAIVGGIGYAAKQALTYKQVKDLQGRSALITGAAGGLGREICLELARQREVTTFVLWDIQKEALEETSELIKKANPTAKIIIQKVNLADREAIYKTAKETISQLGNRAPYVVVNNAGIVSGSQGCLETPDHKIELETQINALAHVWIAKAFIPTMISSSNGAEGGHFVNVASFAAYVSTGDLTTYAMSKKAAKGFAEGLNAEMQIKGLSHLVKISLICPGHIQTALFQGFEGGGLTMTPTHVAKKAIDAVKREIGLVPLPAVITPAIMSVAVSEMLGYLTLPQFGKGYSPMKGWSSTQADSLFNAIQKKN